MTSKTHYDEAFVWIWLPEQTKPVVAGRLVKPNDGRFEFIYGRSYLERKDRISIYEAELPLRDGIINTDAKLEVPNCLRDGSPDAWGRRVIINRLTGIKGVEADSQDFDELTYMLESGSDRVGMLDFQISSNEYSPRQKMNATLEELMQSAERVEKGVPLTPELDQALQHGTSLGGARPKAMIDDRNAKYIAKFSASNDLYNVVKAEFIAMRLAKKVGLNVANVRLENALGKDVILIERFDRTKMIDGFARRGLISALTLLGLAEHEARYASYEDFATIIRHKFTNPKETLEEMFSRLVFNVLCGNNDDHARNHAAFWDGKSLELTPAYDICPQGRSGGEATQAMLIQGNNKSSKVTTCIEAANLFQLSKEKAISIIKNQIEIIEAEYENICVEANLSSIERKFFWQRQFLNPFALQDFSETT